MNAIGPVITNVQRDELGVSCRTCLVSGYLAKVVNGQPVYRHVERKPPCLFDAAGKPR